MTNQNKKFRGGLHIGSYAVTWPNGVLEINQNSLILRDEMMKKNYEFSREEVDRVEIKRDFPIIGYGIRIHHNKKDYEEKTCFWYISFRFEKLIKVLKEFGWNIID